jgi:uncharacterized protein YaaW (UPF0174 family)
MIELSLIAAGPVGWALFGVSTAVGLYKLYKKVKKKK